MLAEEEYEALHRIGAIRKLRWSDIDLEAGVVLWRAEHEKTGYEHRTPVTAEALAVLEEALTRNQGNGDSPVLPAPRDATRCAGRTLVRYWWNRAQKLAGLEPKRGRGWHSLRRKFASDLMEQPLKVLCELGAGRRPKRCSSVISEPTRDSFGRHWKPARDLAAEARNSAGVK